MIEANVTKNDCQFEQCRHYNEGKCLNGKARKDCLEIAMAVLCATDRDAKRGLCEFCADLYLAKNQNETKCERYNRKDKVAKAKARIGVKFVTYMTDCHSRINEKDSKVYKIKYCPFCGKSMDAIFKGKK